ncbi:hypothetical protein Tco_0566668 [Tanacetum coccineum]
MRISTFSNVPFDQFITHIFSSGQSEYTPTPPINIADKDKGLASPSDDSTMKMITPLMEKGGLTLHLYVLKKFRTLGECALTIKEAARITQKEKRFANLKASNEKFEKALKNLTPAQRMA